MCLDKTPFSKYVNELVSCRDELDFITTHKLGITIDNIKKVIEDANIDEVTLDNYKPEESTCKYNQDVLKAVRKELEETRNTISSSISDLAFLQDEIENIYNLVNDGCID